VGWDCLNCGTRNSGTTNFCLECGTGLASRCLKCEFPVYTSICHRCGSHQEALLRLRSIEADRAEWVPIQRSYLDAERRIMEQQQAKAAAREAKQHRRDQLLEALPEEPQPSAADLMPGWRQVDKQMQQAAQTRSRRHAQTRSMRRRRVWRIARDKRMALLWILVGLSFMAWQFQTPIAGWMNTAMQSPAGIAVEDAFNTWWKMALTVRLGSVDTGSPEYAAFFAVTLFALAALPVVGYTIISLLRRLLS
jgi:hypothetical protein